MAPETTALLYDLGRKLAALIELEELLPYTIGRVKELFRVESAAILLLDATGETLLFPYVDDADPAVIARLQKMRVPRERGIAGWVVSHGEPLLVCDVAGDPRFYAEVDRSLGRTTRDLLCVPLRTRRGVIGVVEVINKCDGTLTPEDLAFLDALSGSVAVAIENARLFAELKTREAVLQREVVSLRRAAADSPQLRDVVARSPAMQEVLALMEGAIATPISVLIEGETGTGKELIARAIHYTGARREKAFVAINCAALNDNLLESELFGHRQGAFTGALRDKKGLFEVAHEGTVFLDEIGETSPAFQAKLLRVLQEGEIVPVGETRPKRVDARVISATNRDLRTEIQAGRFREDLYYRIATFPISLPPLRERPEDLPLLVDHLLHRAAERLGKDVRRMSPEALTLLEEYAWPGNVRELQNEIERAVSLTPVGTPLGVDQLSRRIRAGDTGTPGPAEAPLSLRTAMERSERDHLKRALAVSGGNVSHTARALGISRVALQRKMKAFALRDDGER
jgi:Nif-specific regulatory protein